MVAVVAIVIYDGKVLIGKKRSDSPKKLAGQWHVLGETIQEDETDEQALIRGVKEEADLEIKVGKYIASHTTPTSKSEARWYECFADTSQVNYSSDLEDIKWVPKNDVLRLCSKRAVSLWPEEIIDYFS